MYVLSLVSHVLSGTLACLVIMDHRPLLSCQLRRPFRFAESDQTGKLSVYPSAKTPRLILCLLRLSSLFPLCLLVRRFRFHPGVDVDARLRLKQPPRRHSGRTQDRHDLEVFSAHGR